MKKKQTYQEFKAEVEALFMKRHGITIGDCTDEEMIQREHKDGSSAVDFVEWIATKYDLDRIDLEPFTMKQKKL
jgi:hypothetical protein